MLGFSDFLCLNKKIIMQSQKTTIFGIIIILYLYQLTLGERLEKEKQVYLPFILTSMINKKGKLCQF